MTSMRETCGALKDHWYVACLSKRVTRERPASAIVLETRLVVFRKSNGELGVLRDRCSHRNQYLSLGRVEGGCIRCPYHGWSFDDAGRCVDVPTERLSGKSVAKRGVEAFPVVERDGLVWVWMGGSSVAPTYEPLPMPHVGEEGWGGYFLETELENDVTNCVENYMDVPHSAWVHHRWFRSRQGIKVRATVERSPDGVLVTYHSDEDRLGYGDWFLNPDKLPLRHTDRFWMPSNTRVDYVWGDGERGFTMSSSTTPVTPRLTRTYTWFAYKAGRMNAFLSLAMPLYTRYVIEQDVETLSHQGRSLAEVGPEFRHTAADVPHVFIESLRRFAEEGAVGTPPEPAVKEIEFWI